MSEHGSGLDMKQPHAAGPIAPKKVMSSTDELVRARRLAPLLTRIVKESAEHLTSALDTLSEDPTAASMKKATVAVSRLEKWLGELEDELLVLQKYGEVFIP